VVLEGENLLFFVQWRDDPCVE
jgi:hAT family C-terminal dimerisation region